MNQEEPVSKEQGFTDPVGIRDSIDYRLKLWSDNLAAQIMNQLTHLADILYQMNRNVFVQENEFQKFKKEVVSELCILNGSVDARGSVNNKIMRAFDAFKSEFHEIVKVERRRDREAARRRALRKPKKGGKR